MKRCCTCNISKPPSDFYKRATSKDGLRYECKACGKAYKQDHKEDIRAYMRAYRQTDTGRILHNASVKRSHVKFPEKIKARHQLQYAVNSGKVRRSVFCEACGLPAETQGHHADYSRPLEADWLCQGCHQKTEVKI